MKLTFAFVGDRFLPFVIANDRPSSADENLTSDECI